MRHADLVRHWKLRMPVNTETTELCNRRRELRMRLTLQKAANPGVLENLELRKTEKKKACELGYGLEENETKGEKFKCQSVAGRAPVRHRGFAVSGGNAGCSRSLQYSGPGIGEVLVLPDSRKESVQVLTVSSAQRRSSRLAYKISHVTLGWPKAIALGWLTIVATYCLEEDMCEILGKRKMELEVLCALVSNHRITLETLGKKSNLSCKELIDETGKRVGENYYDEIELKLLLRWGKTLRDLLLEIFDCYHAMNIYNVEELEQFSSEHQIRLALVVTLQMTAVPLIKLIRTHTDVKLSIATRQVSLVSIHTWDRTLQEQSKVEAQFWGNKGYDLLRTTNGERHMSKTNALCKPKSGKLGDDSCGIAEGQATQTVITHNAAYQADDLDAYDSRL
ncbi:hypothetical protein Tco_0006484 [Tanacetum coccineum]